MHPLPGRNDLMEFKKQTSRRQSFLMPSLEEPCDPRQPLKNLADQLPWVTFEEAFGEYYSNEGRPAKSTRLMVSFLLIKQLENLSDEVAVARWVQNPYYQYFFSI